VCSVERGGCVLLKVKLLEGAVESGKVIGDGGTLVCHLLMCNIWMYR